MYYLEHCRTAIGEQVQVLIHYHLEIDDPDYEFIRNHALSIYQFSDHILSVQGLAEVSQDFGGRMDTSELLNKDQCRKALSEQIQMLSQYLQQNDEPDYAFVRIHALYIMQLTDHLRRPKGAAPDPTGPVDRIARCNPTA